MDRRGMAFDDELSSWNWEPENGYGLVRKFLRRGERPRALLCLNDRLAFGAYQAIAEAGLKVPHDISIVSFDNDELASYLRPGLTTIGLPHEEMGRLSVKTVLATPLPETATLVPMEVHIRDSIRPGEGG